MKIIKAPNDIDVRGFSLFLAGSIEMGQAENWQERIERELKNDEGIILNPRRDNWDSSWVQSINNPQFREQVEWELRAMENCDLIALYFDKDTKSPISLLELGLFARFNKLVVFCPNGFWRKGNVDIVCKKYDIHQTESIEEMIGFIRGFIRG